MGKPVLFAAAIGLGGYFFLPEPGKSAKGTGRLQAATLSQGTLLSVDKEGQASGICPLKHTDVQGEISGQLARVTVTQEFENPSQEKIEAIYTFPLPQNAAVDDMTMLVGARTVKGTIKRREEAKAIFEAARKAGNVASLLDQQRPNIFTQAVTNIAPGEKVKVTISYVETLKYEDGSYSFVFPMVVGPRYNPSNVTDAALISPPVAIPGTRAGHDISLQLKLDAGVPLDGIESTTHGVDIARVSMNRATVKLKDLATLPNKDFILKYDVAGKKVQDAVLMHRSAKGGFFSMILQPPERVNVQDVTPKELVFVVDTSGSMMGHPLDKVKETMKMAFEGMNPSDTFNLITFSGDEHILFPKPVPATRENIRVAWEFMESRRGSGGTEMMKAIRAALDPSDRQDHIRIACFMTDGYVGNDMQIIAEIQKHPNARIFSFGIGSSVNRFLLDKMAEQGRGEVEYVSLTDDGSAAAKRFYERVRNPLLTDISVDWSGLPVADVYPNRIPDLFSAKPVVITGRYSNAAEGVIRLRGKVAGRAYSRDIRVTLPAAEAQHDVLATLWARTRIDDLMARDFNGIQNGTPKADVKEAITQLGLDYRLMTQFTSFVAVEEQTVTVGGVPKRIEVPVEMPEGVSYEGVFGKESDAQGARLSVPSPMAATTGFVGGGFGRQKVASRQPLAAQEAAPAMRDEKRGDFTSKLDSRLLAVINGTPTGLVRNGKVEVAVVLADDSPQSIEALKQLGFEVIAHTRPNKTVSGRLAAEKLAALLQLANVKYVSPAGN